MIRQFVWVCVLSAMAATTVVSADGNLPATSPDGPALVRLAESTGIRQFTVQTLQPAGEGGLRIIPLQIDGRSCTAVLYPHSVRVSSFSVRVMDRTGVAQDLPGPSITSYRGRLEGDLEGRIIAGIHDGKMNATIQTSDAPDGQWVIRPIEGVEGFSAAEHMVYRSIDAPSEPVSCGVESSTGPEDELPPPPATAPLDVLVCEIACDADYEFFQLNGGSIEATVADIENIINGVSAIYERDTKISFQITNVLVRTEEPDPYSSTNAYALLTAVSDDWRANHGDIPRDFVHLFTGKTLTNCTCIGISEVGTLCHGYCVVQSRYSTDMARRIAISAHEIGHLIISLGSGHCEFSGTWCRIMCSNLGCGGGVQSFGPAEVQKLREGAATKPCLTTGSVDIPVISLPFYDNFEYAPTKCSRSCPVDPALWTAPDLTYAINNCGANPINPKKHMRIVIEKNYSTEVYPYALYGTVRTHPMALRGPARLNYTVCQAAVEQGQMLKVEYFNSAVWDWQPLESITSTGTVSTTFVPHEVMILADASGDFFAIRFSSFGTKNVNSTCWWYVDDVSIVELPNPADINGDTKVNLEDFSICAAAWLSQEGQLAWNPACNLKQPQDTIINLDDFLVWVENWLRTL